MIFERAGLLFVFNFHPTWSQGGFRIPVRKGSRFEVAFTSDDGKYGGWDQMAHMTYEAQPEEEGEDCFIEMHLPCRTCAVLIEHPAETEEKDIKNL